MKKPLSFLVVLILAFGTTGQASALGLSIGDGGAVNPNPLWTSIVNYFDAPGASTPLKTERGTIIEKFLDVLGPVDLTVTYNSDEFDFASGFNWSERIWNATPYEWIDFHVEIGSEGGTFVQDDLWPSIAKIDIGDGAMVTKLTNGTVELSSDKKSVWFLPDDPVLPGKSLDIHIPIEGLPIPDEGAQTSFVLSQRASVVPEPATMFLLGTGLVGMVMIGRWKFFKRQ